MAHRKRPAKAFLCYAHADSDYKDLLMSFLCPLFAASDKYDFRPWHDREILIGQDWRAEIDRALDECDFGLPLLSVHSLRSHFITTVELPRFVGPDAKPLIPVAAGLLSLDRFDMKGIAVPGIFLHRN